MKDTKSEIIEKSFELFKENGYENVTINDICKKCMITKTTFYRYLSSKEDCLTYFFANINDELGTVAIKLASTDNHVKQIILIFDLIIDKMYLFGKELYSQLYITNLKKYNGTFDEITALKELVIIMIDKAKASNQINNNEDSTILYDSLSTLLFGCGIKWCLGLIEDPKTSFVKTLYTMLQVNENAI